MLNSKTKKNKPLVIPIIIGPTSSGKTSLALKLCENNGASIVSADSRQVYKYMDIGTGKIPVNSDIKTAKDAGSWTLNGIEIFGYDLTTPDQYFSSYDYAVLSLSKMEKLVSENKPFVIVGGTGFYVDILTGRINLDSAAPDLNLRQDLEKQTLDELLKTLQKVNPQVYLKIDQKNKNRVFRAVEKSLSNKIQKPLPLLKNVEPVFFGLNSEREYLYERADKWADEVWANGLIEETKFLMEKFSGNQKLNGLIYRSVVDYIEGKSQKDEAIQKSKWDLHAYIRRQLTWFRKNKEIKWFDIAGQGAQNCIIEIEKLWTKKS